MLRGRRATYSQLRTMQRLLLLLPVFRYTLGKALLSQRGGTVTQPCRLPMGHAVHVRRGSGDSSENGGLSIGHLRSCFSHLGSIVGLSLLQIRQKKGHVDIFGQRVHRWRYLDVQGAHCTTHLRQTGLWRDLFVHYGLSGLCRRRHHYQTEGIGIQLDVGFVQSGGHRVPRPVWISDDRQLSRPIPDRCRSARAQLPLRSIHSS